MAGTRQDDPFAQILQVAREAPDAFDFTTKPTAPEATVLGGPDTTTDSFIPVMAVTEVREFTPAAVQAA